MRGFFIHLALAENDVGVRRKIDSQVSALSRIADVKAIPVQRTVLGKILERTPFASCRLDAVNAEIDCPDFLYIRKWAVDRSLLSFLRSMKNTYPYCLIIIEIPAYPYDREYLHRIKDLPILAKDRWNRRRLEGCVDRIATYSDDDRIFGVETIQVVNGIDVDSVRPKTQAKKEAGRIDLIAVATMLKHHGYDRVLQGLGDYYRSGPDERVVLHLVGDGPELRNYRALAESNNIDEHVEFHGRLEGESLDALYDYCDIGLVTFGAYRNGVKRGSFLKSREYLARGIPMVAGCPIDIFENTSFPYCHQVPNNDTPVPIAEVVTFYKETVLAAPSQRVVESMRQYASRTCDMRRAMDPVVSFLTGDAYRCESTT
ncbi:MAG: glycosyltransferase [Actinomycetia bacterium]|nr:glycosyltransferase [Actinomycetes bacterium]